ncbi:MAG: hypothetical protein ACI8P7_001511 [Candidatus Azotimanducaceae bacterium]|jgi:hypothetical protein
MIQRVQSLYLILLLMVNMIFLPFVALWNIGETEIFFVEYKMFVFLIAMIMGASLASLLQYKVRQRQFAVNRLNLLINLVFMGIVLFLSFKPESGWIDAIKVEGLTMANGGFLPMVNIVLLFLANKGIRKDEDLIKAIDRVR